MKDIDKTFENIINNSILNAEKSTEDYVKDGIIYCGKCNTRKQSVLRNDDGTIARVVNCLCACEKRKAEKEKLEENHERYNRYINELRQTGFTDDEMKKWTFETDDRTNEKISNVARNYAENFDYFKSKGKGLTFFGSVGTGKTFYSACIVNALIDKGVPCMITNFSRLVNTIYASEKKQEFIDSLNDFDLLVIDDLASERDTEFVNEIIQTIIDSRYRSGLPLIITTNLSAEELKHSNEMKRQRVYSRLFEMTIFVEVVGKDRRKGKNITDYKEMADILGL